MSIKITKYNALCNLGNSIEEIYKNAIDGISDRFEATEDLIKGKPVRIGKVNTELPEIKNPDFDLRCNRLILKVIEPIKDDIENLIKKYGSENIAIVAATTNSGVEEYENSKNPTHCEPGNPAKFLKEYLNLKNLYTSVSTACSSGIKAFSSASEFLKNNIADAAIVVGIDSIAKVPIFGFNSLEILSTDPSIPFSKNRKGINIGEAVCIFLLEKNVKDGIEISGIGETTDVFHSTTPDPSAVEAVRAINQALENANLKPEDIDYINLHGTGTPANDLMEARAVYSIFKGRVPSSSTKPLTGHCLGAAASVETALCCQLLEQNDGKLFPHIYDGIYDENLEKIKLVPKNFRTEKISACLNLSFGFGGTNTAIILRRKDD